MKILLFVQVPWVGDHIRLFSLIQSLKRSVNNCEIWYLGRNDYDPINTSLKQYGIKVQTIQHGLEDFGQHWQHALQIRNAIKASAPKRFDLVISMGRKIKEALCARQIPTKRFYACTWGFRLCIPRGQYRKHELDPSLIVDNVATMLKMSIPLKHYLINMIDEKLFREAYRLLPNDRYIGFALTQGHPTERKSWPVSRFINLAKNILANGYTPVFLISTDRYRLIRLLQREIPQAVFPESETTMACPALVTTLATRLDAAVTICCGIMHMIGLTKTPIVGIFGPTEPRRTASQIKNIYPVDSKIMYGTTNIHTITESDVLRQLDAVLQHITANKKTHLAVAHSH